MPWPLLLGALGMVGGCIVLLFALWLEAFTRHYGHCGGPPNERPSHKGAS